ncbi:MAG: DUF4397 domain-containing protein [Bacteroidetes bacterium]|nr:DUF4397 domain-containing protein [Bacteroidota bacterium]
MQQKLLRKAGLLVIVLLTSGVVFNGCIDEPNPPVLDRIVSEVRFVHAVSNAPAVDIWVDNDKVVSGASYKQASEYLTINSGNRMLRVVPAGADTSVSANHFRQLVTVRSLMKITMVFHQNWNDVQLLTTQERFTYADETSALLDSSEADLKVINVNFDGVAYGIAKSIEGGNYQSLVSPVPAPWLSAYTRIPAQSASCFISRAGGTVILPSEFTHEFKAGHRYSFVIVGTGEAEELEVLPLEDDRP